MRVYVAGPMTGLPNFNYDAFHDAAGRLREMGHEVENPAENVNESGEWIEWMKLALAQVLRCDGIALLDGWESSAGATLEVHVATNLKLIVGPLSEWVGAK